MNSLTIRFATVDDGAAISALILALQPYLTIEPDGSGAEAFLTTLQPELIRGNLQSTSFRYQVAHIGDELAGVVAMRDNSHLFSLYVASAFHGEGLGRRLWEVARDDALALGNPGRFTVNSSGFAQAMYEHLGFLATGPLVAQHGISYIPMVLEHGA